MSVRPGGTFADGRYRIERPLGDPGAHGEVWKAFDTHRNHHVALKLIRDKDRGATWHEASVLTALRSEHILAVHNADVSVDVPYLDTALAKCSIDAVSEPLGLEVHRAVGSMRKVLSGLELCHARGLLHRDIKPKNVFLTEGGDAKLGDFGTAHQMDSAGSCPAAGDFYIRAPELFDGGRCTVASDVYSAAVTLYALLAGGNPFRHIKTHPDLGDAIKSGSYPNLRDSVPNASRALAASIRSGMNIDPAQRFRTASDFNDALALPRDEMRFTPITPHDHHERCWEANGRGAALRICTTLAESPRHLLIETRYEKSLRRLPQHCLTTTRSEARRRLRAIFDRLR